MFVRSWMTGPPVSIDPETPLAEADRLMREHQIRRLPVVEGNRLVGIITRSDIDRAQPSVFDPESDADELGETVATRSLMTMSPLAVAPEDTLDLAARIMGARKIGGMPVLQEGRLVGMLTESDLFRALVEILGSDKPGTHLELKIDHKPASFYELLDRCREYGLTVCSLTINVNHSHEHQLITLKVFGERTDALVEHLWQSGFQINLIKKDGAQS